MRKQEEGQLLQKLRFWKTEFDKFADRILKSETQRDNN